MRRDESDQQDSFFAHVLKYRLCTKSTVVEPLGWLLAVGCWLLGCCFAVLL